MPQANQPAPDPLFIKYPDGQVVASGVYIWSIAENKYIPWTGEVTVGSVTSSGVIADGVNNAILATVRDYTNSNPLAVQLTDSNGDAIAGSSVVITGPLGQALAAASLPVVLTAAQLTTLTPPAAITGFATETTLAALNTKVTAVNTGAVVVSSSALPSGASTAAKQPALGTAGTASADVISVQGIASMTPLLATASGDVASDGVDSGNPVKVGYKALSTLPTAVSTADRTNAIGDLQGRAFVRNGQEGPSSAWTHSQHNPSANTKATITKASAGAGIRNVCTSLTVSLAAGATAPTAIQLTVALIDGASGGTTYLWGPTVISLPAVAGAISAFVLSNCWKPGTAATGMTLEFSAAGGANTIESVSFDSTTVAE